MTTVAIIPARGGSKRIPRKNIRPFHGVPAIVRTIETAKRSNCFDNIIISTDDEQIADIATKFGAEVPFMRPKHLADDFTTTSDVVVHAIEEIQARQPVSAVCCIYPVTPLLTAERLREGVKLLHDNQSDFVAPVCEFNHPPTRALGVKKGFVQMENENHLVTRTQDTEPLYHDAGQFYWGWATSWLTSKPIFQARTIPLHLDRSEAVDIDCETDWLICEALFAHLQETEAAIDAKY